MRIYPSRNIDRLGWVGNIWIFGVWASYLDRCRSDFRRGENPREGLKVRQLYQRATAESPPVYRIRGQYAGVTAARAYLIVDFTILALPARSKPSTTVRVAVIELPSPSIMVSMVTTSELSFFHSFASCQFRLATCGNFLPCFSFSEMFASGRSGNSIFRKVSPLRK